MLARTVLYRVSKVQKLKIAYRFNFERCNSLNSLVTRFAIQLLQPGHKYANELAVLPCPIPEHDQTRRYTLIPHRRIDCWNERCSIFGLHLGCALRRDDNGAVLSCCQFLKRIYNVL